MINEQRLRPTIVDLVSKLTREEFVIDKTGVKLVEVLADPIHLDPTQPYLNFGKRKTPEKYVDAELKWYISQDLSVAEIGKIAKIWRDVAAHDGTINSNYGWCIFSKENGYQFDNVVQELLNHPHSRRATMIYNRPSMWKDYNRDGMNDFICTFATQHFIRDNQLISIVNMRSNDLIFGFFNDFAWQCWVHMALMQSLGLDASQSGKIIWVANSLHVYERHFDMLKSMADWIINH